MSRLTILCVASYFKGTRFIEECHHQGCRVFLLTRPDLADQPWPRACLEEIFFLPEVVSRDEAIQAVSFLARNHELDRIVPLDDYDVELAAAMREHLRLPGMGDTTARFFRDKLAMRVQCRQAGICCPRFEHVLHHGRLHRFMEEVPGPWVLKPRSEAGAVGIRRVQDAPTFWNLVETLADQQSHFLLEEFVTGPVFHVDSLVWEGEVVFAAPHGYLRPPFEVWNHGGVFGTRTVGPGSPLRGDLLEANRRVLDAMGLVRGATHAEFIRSEKDGRLHFLEVAARVGGAHIDDLVEACTGVNLWQEWARIELASARGEVYRPPEARQDGGGLLICLARQEKPDLASFDAPEVVWRLDKAHHAGLILSSPDSHRVESLFPDYVERFERDYLAVCSPTDKPLA
jgi:biotin carboxylase